MAEELTRREALALLMIVPQACSSDLAHEVASGGATATGGAGTGGESTGGGGVGGSGAGAGSSAGSGGAFDASTGDGGLACDDPGSGSAGCVASPKGKLIGEPCAFAAAGLHAVLGADMFDSVLVGRDDGGLYARSAVCTHQGCNLADGGVTATGIVCPCHGSEFDPYGVVKPGQAAKADLPSLALALGCDGQLYVDFDTPVSPAFRLKVI